MVFNFFFLLRMVRRNYQKVSAYTYTCVYLTAIVVEERNEIEMLDSAPRIRSDYFWARITRGENRRKIRMKEARNGAIHRDLDNMFEPIVHRAPHCDTQT